jgi:hypothetical protein
MEYTCPEILSVMHLNSKSPTLSFSYEFFYIEFVSQLLQQIKSIYAHWMHHLNFLKTSKYEFSGVFMFSLRWWFSPNIFWMQKAQGACSHGRQVALEGKIVGASVLTVKIRQPSHEFTFGAGISFIPYPLVLTPVV